MPKRKHLRACTRAAYPTPGRWQPPPTQPPARRTIAVGSVRNGHRKLVVIDPNRYRVPRPGTVEFAEFQAAQLADESRAFDETIIPYPGSVFTRSWPANDAWRSGQYRVIGLPDDCPDARPQPEPAAYTSDDLIDEVMHRQPRPGDDDLIRRVRAWYDDPRNHPRPTAQDAHDYAVIMAQRNSTQRKAANA